MLWSLMNGLRRAWTIKLDLACAPAFMLQCNNKVRTI